MFYYEDNFLDIRDLNTFHNYLNSINDFKNNPKCSDITQTGRLQKWYHIKNKYFCSKWKTNYDWWNSFDYDTTLISIQNMVQKKLNSMNYDVKINSCLLNKYRDGNDYIAPHRDSKLAFGNNPVICILSFGQERTIRFTKTEYNDKNISLTKKHKDNIYFDYILKDNSIFIMSENSQTNYSHQILKDDSINERYSLTFREHII